MAPHAPHAEHVVADTVLAVLVGADIDANDAAAMRSAIQTISESIEPFIVEAQTINHRAIGPEPKDAWPRVSRLRARRDGPALDETKACREHRVRGFAIL